jgi:hypothetical protein
MHFKKGWANGKGQTILHAHSSSAAWSPIEKYKALEEGDMEA